MKMSNMPSKNNHAGFTLVELMLALAISGIIVGAIYLAYSSQQRTYLVQDQVVEMQQNLRAGLMLMARDIRMAGYDKNGTGKYSITTATASKLVFSADLNDDGGAPGAGETMTYELYTPPGAGMTSLRRIAGQASIADNIEAIEFQYLDSAGAVTTTLSKIRTIRVSILARAGKPDRKFTNSTMYCPASHPVKNLTTTPPQCEDSAGATLASATWGPYSDNYRRRLLITTINCRNMGL